MREEMRCKERAAAEEGEEEDIIFSGIESCSDIAD